MSQPYRFTDDVFIGAEHGDVSMTITRADNEANPEVDMQEYHDLMKTCWDLEMEPELIVFQTSPRVLTDLSAFDSRDVLIVAEFSKESVHGKLHYFATLIQDDVDINHINNITPNSFLAVHKETLRAMISKRLGCSSND